jgi:nickel-type superoxide dismutase maturation protease
MIYLRRVSGESMLPGLKPNQVVFAVAARHPRVGEIVIVRHNGMEKIKRIAKVRKDAIYLIGDNPSASTDSRTFGWLSKASMKARVVWPRYH